MFVHRKAQLAGFEVLGTTLWSDDLQGTDEADATRLADMRAICKAAQAGLKLSPSFGGIGHQIALFDDLEVFQRDSCPDRVCATGIAVAQHADATGLVGDGSIDLFGHHKGGEGKVRRGDLFREGHDVGFDPVGLAAEHVAGAAKAADDLVGDQEDVVFAQNCLDFLPIGFGRHHHAPCPHHGFGNKGGDGLWAFGLDHRVEVVGAAGGKIFFALTLLPLAPVMRTGGVQDPLDRQVEGFVVVRQPGHGGRRNRHPVITADAADDLLFLRLAKAVRPVPEHLEDGVIGLRPGIGEEHLAHGHRREADQLFGKINCRPVRAVGEVMVIRQLLHLPGGGIDQALFVKAHSDGPESGHAFDIAVALGVKDIDAFTPIHDQRALFFVCTGIGVAVEVVGDIAGFVGIGAQVHGGLRALAGTS